VQLVVSSVARRFGLTAHQLGTLGLLQLDFGARNARVAMGIQNGLIVDNGACFSFGKDEEALGRQVSEDARRRQLKTPQPVGGALLQIRVGRVAVGDRFSVAAGDAGGLFSWGRNSKASWV